MRDVTSKDYSFFFISFSLPFLLALNKEVTVMLNILLQQEESITTQPFQVPWHFFGPSSGIKSKSALTGQAGEDGHTCLVCVHHFKVKLVFLILNSHSSIQLKVVSVIELSLENIHLRTLLLYSSEKKLFLSHYKFTSSDPAWFKVKLTMDTGQLVISLLLVSASQVSLSMI